MIMNKIRQLLESKVGEDQLIAIEMLAGLSDEEVQEIVDKERSSKCFNKTGIHGVIRRREILILLGSETIVWHPINQLDYWTDSESNSYKILNHDTTREESSTTV